MRSYKRLTELFLALALAAGLPSAALSDWSVETEVVIESEGYDTGDAVPRVSISATPTPDPAKGRGGTKLKYGVKRDNSDALLGTAGKTAQQIYSDWLTVWRSSIGRFRWSDADGNTPKDREAIRHILEAEDQVEAAYWTLRLMILKGKYYGALPSEEEFYARQEAARAEGGEEFLRSIAISEALRGHELDEKELALFQAVLAGAVEVLPYSRVEAMLTPTRGGPRYEWRYIAERELEADGDTLVAFKEGIINFFAPWAPQELYHLTIQDNVNGVPIRHIGENAFDNYTIYYRYFEVPEGVETIGSGAFTHQKMTYVQLPDTLTDLASGTFNGCENLSALKIPANVTALQAGVLSNCDNLRQVVIPATVMEISDDFIDHRDPEKVRQVVIYGYGDSAAEAYAHRNGLYFVDIGAQAPQKEEMTKTPVPVEAALEQAATPEGIVTPVPTPTTEPTPTPGPSPTPDPEKAILRVRLEEVYLNDKDQTASVSVRVVNEGKRTAEDVRVRFSAGTEPEQQETKSLGIGGIGPGKSGTAGVVFTFDWDWEEYVPSGWGCAPLLSTVRLELAVKATCSDGRPGFAKGEDLLFYGPDWLTERYPNIAEALSRLNVKDQQKFIESLASQLAHRNYAGDEKIEPEMKQFMREKLPGLRKRAFTLLNGALETAKVMDRNKLKKKDQPPCVTISDKKGVMMYMSSPEALGQEGDYLTIFFHESGHVVDFTAAKNGDAVTQIPSLGESIVKSGKAYTKIASREMCRKFMEEYTSESFYDPVHGVVLENNVENFLKLHFPNTAGVMGRPLTQKDMDGILDMIADYWANGNWPDGDWPNEQLEEATALADRLSLIHFQLPGKAYDVLSGITSHRLGGQSGHSDAYWHSGDDEGKTNEKFTSELWGHFFSAVCRGDGHELQRISDVFPSAFSDMCAHLQTLPGM